MCNLIFIEGISGVGKSTISTVLCERLRSYGYSANCFLEGNLDSPLDLFYVAYLTENEYRDLLQSYPTWSEELQKKSKVEYDYVLVRYRDTIRKYYSPDLYEYLKAHELCFNIDNPVPHAKYSEVFFNLWRLFAKSKITTQEVLIFDGSLLHHQINDLIRNFNATEDQIATYLSVLLQTVESLNPMVFYLASQDVSSRLTEARQSRGQTPPTNEQILFWQRRKCVDLSVLEMLPVKSHIIDISNCNWDLALENIVMSITDSNDSLL